MINDLEAEHLPGCNLAVKRTAFDAIGGFDVRFAAAGDDVDFCWRLLEEGFRIGFHPAAMVWHHRRFTPGAYLRQQIGYGKAEAMLMPLYPERFGLRGGARWQGRVYLESPAARLATSGSLIYHGERGYAPFQALYGGGSSHSPAALTLDWTWVSVALTLVLIGFIGEISIPLIAGGAMLLGTLVRALIHAHRASVLPRFDGVLARTGVTILTLLQGPLRSLVRFTGVRPAALIRPSSRPSQGELPDREDLGDASPTRKESRSKGRSCRNFGFWSEDGVGRDAWLDAIESALTESNLTIQSSAPGSEGDLDIDRYSITTVTEYHGGKTCLNRLRLSIHPSRKSRILGRFGLLAGIFFITLAAGQGNLLGALAVAGAAFIGVTWWARRQPLRRELEATIIATASELGMTPLH